MTDEVNKHVEVSEAAPKLPVGKAGTAERKAYNNAAKKCSRPKVKAREEKKARRFDSNVEIKPKEAREILLSDRKIQNEHIADVVVALAEVAARFHNIPFNAHLFTHGLRATLASTQCGRVG